MADLSSLEQLLVGAIGTGILGIGSLITWAVKSVVPKILGMLEERNKTLVEAVQRVGKAIDDFDNTLKAETSKIITEVANARDKVIETIDDRRLEELTSEFRRMSASKPDDTAPPPTPMVSRTKQR